MDYYSHLEEKPRDPILGLSVLFAEDKRNQKVNLGVGAYKTEDGKVALFKSVHEAEKILWDEKRSKSYPPIDGDKTFRANVLQLILGEKDPEGFYSAQTVGCTGALRTSAEIFIAMGIKTIYLPDFTWQNHYLLYSLAGLKTEKYPYFDVEAGEINVQRIVEVLRSAPENSAVLFQVSCHNPVGRDPTQDEWHQIVNVIQEKNLFPILDSAYQGFGDGIVEDMFAVELFRQKFDQFFLCYSFAKNFGLYGERLGAFIAFDRHQKSLELLSGNVKHFIRGMYSVPAIHGARIFNTIMQSDELKNLWIDEINSMRDRLKEIRKKFVHILEQAGLERNYNYILQDKGLFSLMGLSENQVVKLRDDYGIYMVKNGRINIAALSDANMGYVAESIHKVLLVNAEK